ncbi:MAG: SDR family oxidoreductase [Roseiflexaceae bacterium]
MSQLAQATVLITGGASGIGYLLGQQLIAHGINHLVIWDINQSMLDTAATTLRQSGVHVTGYHVDITDNAQIDTTLEAMHAAGITIDIVVNNAGIVIGKPFAEYTDTQIAREMTINAVAPMHITHKLLAGMHQRQRGHIVNIASAAALLSNPRMSVYVASKWAITGWSDSLRIELEQAQSPIKVTTVMPYYINTGMFDGVQSRIIPILKPDHVVRHIIRAIERDAVFLRMPWIVNLLPLIKGILPMRWFDVVIGKWFGIYDTMQHFTGRKQ